MEFGDLLVPALIAFWVYCIFDVIRTPEGNTENLPKIVWLLVVVFLNFIGGLAWLLLGRPRHGERAPRLNMPRIPRRDPAPTSAPSTPAPPPVDEDYHRKRDEAIRRYNEAREAELRRREAEMERRAAELRQREQGTSESS